MVHDSPVSSRVTPLGLEPKVHFSKPVAQRSRAQDWEGTGAQFSMEEIVPSSQDNRSTLGYFDGPHFGTHEEPELMELSFRYSVASECWGFPTHVSFDVLKMIRQQSVQFKQVHEEI
jgi:hypothetical protein